jgi:hypothetical protein
VDPATEWKATYTVCGAQAMLVGRPSVFVTEVAANHFIRIEEGMGPVNSPAASRQGRVQPRPRGGMKRAVCFAAAALLLWASESLGQRRAEDERLRPPAQLTCPRDQLTSYTGRVLSLKRATGRTTLRIRTEWETTERVIVQHSGTRDPSPRFLIGGEPFTNGDWMHIEDAGGHLRQGLQATAWVCTDGSVIVDWKKL